MDPHDQAELIVLVQLGFGEKVAAVDQRESIACSVILAGLPVAQDHKGVLLVAGGTAHAANGMDVMGHMLPFCLPFLAVTPGKAYQVKVCSV